MLHCSAGVNTTSTHAESVNRQGGIKRIHCLRSQGESHRVCISDTVHSTPWNETSANSYKTEKTIINIKPIKTVHGERWLVTALTSIIVPRANCPLSGRVTQINLSHWRLF